MGEKKKALSPPVVGGSSLLVIFAILCLVIFALLSLSTVTADARLADRSRELVTGYYAADGQAEEILARLRAGEVPEGVTAEETEEGALCRYQCAVSSTQSLRVEALVRNDGTYQVLRWQLCSTAEFTPHESLPTWAEPQNTGGE